MVTREKRDKLPKSKAHFDLDAMYSRSKLCSAIADSTRERCRKFASPGSAYCHLHQPKVPKFDWKDGILLIGGANISVQLLGKLYDLAILILRGIESTGPRAPEVAHDSAGTIVGRDVSVEKAHKMIMEALGNLGHSYGKDPRSTFRNVPYVMKLCALLQAEQLDKRQYTRL